ncbi:unnamed protein product [Durusdinium trenchii]|uniref:Uncharacterized protein n=2 Tax=Durusdinium trenchii TaxID=1381693 RepID=A0ABP0KZM6_9DINO
MTEVIMSLAGPLAACDVSGPVLCREWLLNDQSQLFARSKEKNAMEQVELSCLARLRRLPLSSLANLYLNEQDALREATNLRNAFGEALVVVSTPPRFASKEGVALLASVASEAKIHVVVGTTPPEDKEFEVQVASVVTDLAAGIGQFWPGFIGEIEGTDLGALAVAVEAQRRSQAPILITGEVSDDAFRILDDAIWRRCAFFDVPSEPALIEIQARGALIGFSAPPGAADVSWQDGGRLPPHAKGLGELRRALPHRPGCLWWARPWLCFGACFSSR